MFISLPIFKYPPKLIIFADKRKKSYILGSIKEIFHGQHRKFAWFVLITTSIFLFTWIVGPGTTVIHWAKTRITIARQESLIKELKRENAELDKKINLLKHDRDTLEKFAREQFHFSAPGEDVYLIEE